jgi:hypothetical protein
MGVAWAGRPVPIPLPSMPFEGEKMPTPREWVRTCELEKAAIEHQSVEKWIEIDRKLDPNGTEEKSKALHQRKEEWLKGCTERLNEARANLRAAEHLDVWSLLETGEGLTIRATSSSTQDDE